MNRSSSLPDSLVERYGRSFKPANVKQDELSPLLKLRTSDLVVDKGHTLVASALESSGNKAGASVAVGFEYALSVGPSRDVTFHIDISGSENLRMSGEHGGGVLRATEVAAGSKDVQIAVVEVCDLAKPWSLHCRYSWTERETSSKELAPGITLVTTEMWTKGRSVTAIMYELKVGDTKGKRVAFHIDFTGSTNLELATGGLRARTVVEPYSSATVGFLQVINPANPWTLKVKCDWSDQAPTSQPVLGRPERRDLAPGLVLITTRCEVNNGDAFRYQLACSKNTVIDFTIDCSESSNMALDGKSSGSTSIQRSIVQPWDRAEVGTVCAIQPQKPWLLKVKLTWSERAPLPPTFVAESEDAAAAAVTSVTEKVANIEIDPNKSIGQANVLQIERSSGSPLGETTQSFNNGDAHSSVHVQPSSIELPTKTSASVISSSAATTAPASATVGTADGALPKPSRRAPGLKLDLDASNSNAGNHGEAVAVTSISEQDSSQKTIMSRRSSGVASGPKIPIMLQAPPPQVPANGQSEISDESKLDTKEISSKVFLTKYQIPGTPTRITYELHIERPCTITFFADFAGSYNLRLERSNDLTITTVAQPFQRTVVAELVVAESGKAWGLKAAYRFQEHDALLSPLSVHAAPSFSDQKLEPMTSPPPPGIIGGDKDGKGGSATDQLASFLIGIGLEEYLTAFRTEQVDWTLLLDMAKNEDSLRSTLKELGVDKLGNRERIITALRRFSTPQNPPTAI